MALHRLAPLAVASFLFASTAYAQTTVVVVQPPPPTVVVVVEPPPPTVVTVVEPAPPAEAPAPSAPPHPPRFVVDLRGDLLMGAGYDGAALGGSALFGVSLDDGVSVLLALGYADAMFPSRSEVSLGVEVQRDFSPHEAAGFLLLGRVGSAFLLQDLPSWDPGVRVSGQLGVGGRFDLSSDLALVIDVRGVMRFRPSDPLGPNASDVTAGAAVSIGLRIRL